MISYRDSQGTLRTFDRPDAIYETRAHRREHAFGSDSTSINDRLFQVDGEWVLWPAMAQCLGGLGEIQTPEQAQEWLAIHGYDPALAVDRVIE